MRSNGQDLIPRILLLQPCLPAHYIQSYALSLVDEAQVLIRTITVFLLHLPTPGHCRIMKTDTFESLLTVSDCLISFFVIFPALCAYWRGAWDLIGYYVLPDQEPLNHFVHIAIGCCTFFNYLILPFLRRRLPRERKVLYFVVTRLFLAFHGLQFMFLWRGIWSLADHYLTRAWNWSLLALVISLFLMSVFKVGRATMWPPFVVSLDTNPNLLVADNRFKVPPSRPFLYALDCFFSAVVVHGMAIFCWRCIWCIWDDLIFPHDSLMSDIVNFAAGTLGTAILFLLQRPLGSVSCHFEKTGRLRAKYAWEGTIYIFVFVVVTSVWRGLWNLNIRYLITDPFLGGWVNHGCGIVLFLFLQTYSLVGGWGVGEDGTESDGGAFFPIKYLHICFEDKLRRRRELREQKEETKDLKEASEPLNVRNSLVLNDYNTEEVANGYMSTPDYFANQSSLHYNKNDPVDGITLENGKELNEENEDQQNNNPESSLLENAQKPEFSHSQNGDPWEEKLA